MCLRFFCLYDVPSSEFRPDCHQTFTELKGELQEQVSWYLKLNTWDKWTSQKACFYLNKGLALSLTVIAILLTINLYNHIYPCFCLQYSGQLETQIIPLILSCLQLHTEPLHASGVQNTALVFSNTRNLMTFYNEKNQIKV